MTLTAAGHLHTKTVRQATPAGQCSCSRAPPPLSGITELAVDAALVLSGHAASLTPY